MTITVMAMFKNESWIINEWIQHYKNEGATRFILIDNDSTDDWRSKIKKEFLNDDSIKFVGLHGSSTGRQEKVYNDCFKTLGPHTEWILPIDLDEFVYSRKGFNTIVDYLKTLRPDISQIKIPWKMFGSSGHESQPPSVIDGFTHYDVNLHNVTPNQVRSHVKSIVRTSCLKKFKLHGHETKSGKSVTLSGKNSRPLDPWIPVENIEDHALHCNHYFTQSLQYFLEVQQNRAGGNNPKHKKDIKWFNTNKDRSTFDNELSQKKYL